MQHIATLLGASGAQKAKTDEAEDPSKTKSPLEKEDPLENEDLENEDPFEIISVTKDRWHNASFGHILIISN